VTGLTNGTAYTFSVTGTNTIGTGSPSGSSNSVTPAPLPTVNLNSASRSISATTVTITGTGFDTTAANNTVMFNLGAVGNVTAATSTQLTVTFTTLPTSIGSLTAIVTTNGQSSGSAVQVATAVAAPTVTASSSNLALNVTTLIIAGTGFDTTAANNTVTFNNGAAGTVTAATSTQLTVTFTSPPSSTGSLTAVVTSFGGISGFPVQVATVVLATQATLVVVPTPGSINVNGSSSLSTTGGSGLGAVSYSLVSGPCTLSGATLTGTGAGSCIVTATKAADSTYASATSSQVTVSVSAGPPPVTNLAATAGPGYITLTFTIPNSPAVASLLQPRTATTYTGTCTSTNGGVTASKTGTSSPLIVTGPTADKSYSCVVTGSDGSGSSSSSTSNVVTPTAPPTPSPSPIPTLSEWAQIMMMFLMILTVGWYGRRLKQR
jgi:hypothetical protein